jgi:hypothetical protein
VELIVCILWSIVSIFFCLSKANGGTSFLLTDGTIMMQESKSADIYWLGVPQATWGSTRCVPEVSEYSPPHTTTRPSASTAEA